MKSKIDVALWNRKEHFLFYKQLEEPFYGVTVTVDCTIAYRKAKEQGISFFIYYLHKTLLAINAVDNFKYRIENDEVYHYESIDASPTISRADGTFGFSLVTFHPDILQFHQNALQEIARVQNTSGLFTRTFANPNIIHFSALPWLDFSAISHARSYTFPDSCPKISFGKMTEHADKSKQMPMSIHVHHGLVDGIHIGQLVTIFQQVMNE